MALIALHGGEELAKAIQLTIALLRPFARVVLAPLAQPAHLWEEIERQARESLQREVMLAHRAHPSLEIGEGDLVLIPGGDPAIAALRVTDELRAALAGCNVVAASAGAMMLGEEMAAGCPDSCRHPEMGRGSGLSGGGHSSRRVAECRLGEPFAGGLWGDGHGGASGPARPWSSCRPGARGAHSP